MKIYKRNIESVDNTESNTKENELKQQSEEENIKEDKEESIKITDRLSEQQIKI